MPKIIITNQNQDSFLKYIVMNSVNGVKMITFLTSDITSFIKLQKILQQAEIKACELIKAPPAYIQAESEPDCCYNIKLSENDSIIKALDAIFDQSIFACTQQDQKKIQAFAVEIDRFHSTSCSNDLGIELMSLKK